jgi:hypothetical protein
LKEGQVRLRQLEDAEKSDLEKAQERVTELEKVLHRKCRKPPRP